MITGQVLEEDILPYYPELCNREGIHYQHCLQCYIEGNIRCRYVVPKIGTKANAPRRMDKIAGTCLVCGKITLYQPSQLVQGRGQTCSVEHRREWTRMKNAGITSRWE